MGLAEEHETDEAYGWLEILARRIRNKFHFEPPEDEWVRMCGVFVNLVDFYGQHDLNAALAWADRHTADFIKHHKRGKK